MPKGIQCMRGRLQGPKREHWPARTAYGLPDTNLYACCLHLYTKNCFGESAWLSALHVRHMQLLSVLMLL